METEMLTRALEHLVELYEGRIVQFLELMTNVKGEFKEKNDSYSRSLMGLEDKICRQEVRRRDLLLSEASVTAEKILGTSEVSPLYINRSVADIGFDEFKVFDELQKYRQEEKSKTLSIKKLLDPLVNVKVKNEAVERLYGKICAWASAEYVSELSQKNKQKIQEEGSRRADAFEEGMYSHYAKIMEYYASLLNGILSDGDGADISAAVADLESTVSEAEIIQRSGIKLDYNIAAVPKGFRITCNKSYGKVRFVAVTEPAFIVHSFPYSLDELGAVFSHSFGDYLESDETHTFSWEGYDGVVPALQYVYPIVEFKYNAVVFPPRYIGDLTASATETVSKVDYTLEDSILTVWDFGGYGFSDMLFVTDERDTLTDVSEIGDHPAMKAKLYRRDPKTDKGFVIPLDRGIHNITLIGMNSESSKVFSIPQIYIGDKIPVMYSVEVKRSRTSKNGCDLTVWFMIDQNSGFERFVNKSIPAIVVRVGEHVPLTKDHGKFAAETENMEFVEEKGSYRATFHTSVSGVDPKYDKFAVFFKEPNNVYQLRKV